MKHEGVMMKEEKPAGRPTEYTEEIADEICEYIANGNSLNKWLNEEEEGKPARSTVYRWLRDQETFRNNYARAKQESADFHAEKILEVATSTELHPNDKRVQIDAMKWVASKLKPKTYGDKLELGGDSNSPLTVQVLTGVPRNSDD